MTEKITKESIGEDEGKTGVNDKELSKTEAAWESAKGGAGIGKRTLQRIEERIQIALPSLRSSTISPFSHSENMHAVSEATVLVRSWQLSEQQARGQPFLELCTYLVKLSDK